MKLTNTIQKKLKVSSTQLLYQSAPYQAAILFATGPFVDRLLTNRSVFAHKYTTPVVVCSEYFMQLQISEKNNFIMSLSDLNILFKMPVKPTTLWKFIMHGIFGEEVTLTICSF